MSEKDLGRDDLLEEELPAEQTDGGNEGEPEEEHEGAEEGVEDDAGEGQDEQQEQEGETDEEAEARRDRNRQKRQQKKDWQRRKDEEQRRMISMLQRDREELAQRLAALEHKQTGSEMAQLDAAVEETARVATFLKDRIREATEKADGSAVADATEKLYQVQRRMEDLNRVKQMANQGRQQPSPTDPRVRNLAQAWATKNSWYDPSGGDLDSELTARIDNRLVQEGWDPRTPEYWEELDARVSKYLPHRKNSGYNKSVEPKKPTRQIVAGSGKENAQSNKAEYTLSPERVQAMKDAGMWNNPEDRKAMVAEYRRQDKLAGKGA